MDWRAALEVVIAHTRHERYRDLCADSHPDRERHRRAVIRKAAGYDGPPREHPPFRRVATGTTEPATPRPAGLARELVVARYLEPLDWLDRVPADIFVSVYAKAHEPYTLAREHRYQLLPNVGREAHAMLWHIVHHYDSLAELTYFAQADALHHAPDFIGRLGVAYEDTTPLGETYSSTHPSAEIHASDRVEWHGGYRVAYGDALAGQGYDGGRPWVNPVSWPHVFACHRPDPLWFAYAAMLAVPRRRIAGRPLALWRWLLAESERTPWDADAHTDPPLTPWQLEALWLYLFGDPAEYPHRTDILAREYPPLLAQAKNLAGAVGRVASALVHREPIVATPEEAARRLEICRSCEFHDPCRGRCTKCGCGGAKPRLQTESCPVGKW